MPGNRSGARLGRVPILAMTTTCSSQFPAIRLDHLDHIPDLHSTYSVPFFVSSATGTGCGQEDQVIETADSIARRNRRRCRRQLVSILYRWRTTGASKALCCGPSCKGGWHEKTCSGRVATALICTGILMGISWWSASRPQVQAARLSLKLLQKQGREYDRLAERLHQLRLAAYERRFGHVARR